MDRLVEDLVFVAVLFAITAAIAALIPSTWLGKKIRGK
jgi:hypothetical protein